MKRIDTLSLIAYISIALLLIPVALLLWLGLAVYRSSLGFGAAVFDSIALTFSASAASSIIIFLLYTPLSYELARRSNAVAESLSDIPASIPHPIAGIALLFLGSNLTPFGRFLNSIGFGLFDSLQGMIAALAFVSAPVYIRAAQSLFLSSDFRAELYSLSLGKSRLSTLYSVVIPRHFRSLISAVLTSMSRAMSEFGSVAIISYYILGGPFSGFRPSSVLVYQYYGYYGPQVAVTASAVLIIFSVLLAFAIRIARGRTDRREHRL